MPVMRFFGVLALAVGLAAGCNNDFHDQPPPTTSLGGPQSFNVTGTLNGDVSSNKQLFVLRIDPGARTMIVGTPGRALSVPLVSSDGISFHAGGPVELPIAGLGCDSAATYADFHFVVGQDSISGAATGTADIRQGDYGFERAAHLEFSGLADTTAPTILSDIAQTDPLAVMSFIASEPLPSGAQAQLVSPTEKIPLAAFGGTDPGSVIGFQKAEGALRYDTTYKLVIDNWTDLAGNPGVTPDGVVTYPSPPLIPADGFEGASGTLAGATIADATAFPPINGEKSAVLGTPGQPIYPQQSTRFTVRLAVAPGDSLVKFSVRQFASSASLYGGSFNTQVRLAAPGGAIVLIPLANFAQSGTDTVLPNGTHVTLGNVTLIEAPLPAGVGDEVVLDFQVGIYQATCSAPVPVPGYQIDDLRVE
jgi:hypothetical protein